MVESRKVKQPGQRDQKDDLPPRRQLLPPDNGRGRLYPAGLARLLLLIEGAVRGGLQAGKVPVGNG